ncbi:MAG: NUDIX domain-containing protein [Candidatus Pacebacteria bacterium]|nr:NUDIX domain-containing protein [Candidatus Paceibacterota bacterium]
MRSGRLMRSVKGYVIVRRSGTKQEASKKMKKIQRTIVAGLIFSQDGKLLLGQKAADSVYPDCWHLPGGGVEPGEEFEQTLIREIREETGLNLADYDFALIDDQGQDRHIKTFSGGQRAEATMDFVIYQFKLDGTASTYQIKPDDDLVRVAWFDKNELGRLKYPPYLTSLLRDQGLV